jgi:hypothetical protein
MPKTTSLFKPAPPTSPTSPLYKLWNVPQSDPFVGQGAFVVREDTHDVIYAAYVAAKNSGIPERAFVMTNANNSPLYGS